MSIPSSNSSLLPLLAPRYWLLWLVLAMLYVITRLPLPAQKWFGRLLGTVLFYLGPYRRHIAAVNIRLCFPELSPGEQQSLLRRHYKFFGMSLIESFASWWCHPDVFEKYTRFEGLENYEHALQKGKGVIVLTGHFTTIEPGMPLMRREITCDVIYRPHKNALFDRIMSKGRQRYGGMAIERRNIKAMIRSLKSNRGIWYAPDQDYGPKHSIFAPFMGIPAATITGTSRLAKLSGAPVVPYVIWRTDNDGYHVKVFPALENFPSDDIEQDTRRINEWLETQIRMQPENYLWTHRRFKTRPEGEERPY